MAPKTDGHRPPEVICIGPSSKNGVYILHTTNGPVHGLVRLDLAIHFSPMADSDYINDPLSIIDAVNNPVVSDADTP